jgi:hypothetical protein
VVQYEGRSAETSRRSSSIRTPETTSRQCPSENSDVYQSSHGTSESSIFSEPEGKDDDMTALGPKTLRERRKRPVFQNSANDGHRRSNSTNRPRPTRASYESQTLSKNKAGSKRSPMVSLNHGRTDEKHLKLRSRSQSPIQQTNSKQPPQAVSEEKERIGGPTNYNVLSNHTSGKNLRIPAATPLTYPTEHRLKSSEQNLSGPQNETNMGEHDPTHILKQPNMKRSLHQECVGLNTDNIAGKSASRRHHIDTSRKTSKGSDVTVSETATRSLVGIVPVNRVRPPASLDPKLSSASQKPNGKDDTTVHLMSKSSTTFAGRISGSVLPLKSIKQDETQQSNASKTIISPDGTASSLSFNDGSTGCFDIECDLLETYEESEEGSERTEISLMSALDVAMSVVKGLLLRELLDCALPDAMNARGESGTTISR